MIWIFTNNHGTLNVFTPFWYDTALNKSNLQEISIFSPFRSMVFLHFHFPQESDYILMSFPVTDAIHRYFAFPNTILGYLVVKLVWNFLWMENLFWKDRVKITNIFTFNSLQLFYGNIWYIIFKIPWNLLFLR